jgi:hypothetical protein
MFIKLVITQSRRLFCMHKAGGKPAAVEARMQLPHRKHDKPSHGLYCVGTVQTPVRSGRCAECVPARSTLLFSFSFIPLVIRFLPCQYVGRPLMVLV